MLSYIFEGWRLKGTGAKGLDSQNQPHPRIGPKVADIRRDTRDACPR